MGQRNFLQQILERKKREIDRRKKLSRFLSQREGSTDHHLKPAETILSALTRLSGERLHVIAEIKMRSPSAGIIRHRTVGAASQIASSYVKAGASAISVLCDRQGFGGTPLDVRRVAKVVSVPILFKEFVLDEIQIRLAREVGADMVLLLACALSSSELHELVNETMRQGLVPLVEVASRDELSVALQTPAPIIGVNSRDLKTFRVDPDNAMRIIDELPKRCLAIYMSGISSSQDFQRISTTRADAVLIGETLMRASDPHKKLAEIIE